MQVAQVGAALLSGCVAVSEGADGRQAAAGSRAMGGALEGTQPVMFCLTFNKSVLPPVRNLVQNCWQAMNNCLCACLGRCWGHTQLNVWASMLYGVCHAAQLLTEACMNCCGCCLLSLLPWSTKHVMYPVTYALEQSALNGAQ